MKSSLRFFTAFLCSCGVMGANYYRSMPALSSLLVTEKAVMNALRRHLDPCEATWHRAAAITPLVRANLLAVNITLKVSRPEEHSLLRLLRLSALEAVSCVLRGFRCPKPVMLNANILPWPTAGDVDGAAAGICRLQKAYHITPEQAIATMRSPQLPEPTENDILLLALHCSLRERALASDWATLGGVDEEYVSFIEQYLPALVASVPMARSKTWSEIVGYPPESPTMWPYRDVVKGAFRSGFTSDDRFGELCHSSLKHDTRPASSLQCWLSRGKHGAASLAPFAVEELSAEEPQAWLVHDFLSEKECAALRRLSGALKPALILESTGDADRQDVRAAGMVWLEKNASTSVIHRRAEVVMGLSTEWAEKVQLLNYGVGGHYSAHFDTIDSWITKERGERLATLLVYLSDVPEGGATAFPEAGLSITPRLGSALFWFNLKEDSMGRWQRDPSAFHGACPVLRGSKWIATLWIHERGQPPDFTYALP